MSTVATLNPDAKDFYPAASSSLAGSKQQSSTVEIESRSLALSVVSRCVLLNARSLKNKLCILTFY